MEFFTKKKKRGFTLIELLVVIAIIGILAAIVLVSLGGARDRARDARIISDMSQLRVASEVFQGDFETYTGLCADSDVTDLQADIATQNGTNFNCYVQTGAGVGNSYCVVVQMNSTEWWCVDSDLRSKQYATTTACAACVGSTCACQ